MFKSNVRNAQAAWLRYLNGAAFASLKKYPSDFFNSDFVGNEPKEAPYEITGNSVEVLEPISFESYMLQMFQLIFLLRSLTPMRSKFGMKQLLCIRCT